MFCIYSVSTSVLFSFSSSVEDYVLTMFKRSLASILHEIPANITILARHFSNIESDGHWVRTNFFGSFRITLNHIDLHRVRGWYYVIEGLSRYWNLSELPLLTVTVQSVQHGLVLTPEMGRIIIGIFLEFRFQVSSQMCREIQQTMPILNSNKIDSMALGWDAWTPVNKGNLTGTRLKLDKSQPQCVDSDSLLSRIC